MMGSLEKETAEFNEMVEKTMYGYFLPEFIKFILPIAILVIVFVTLKLLVRKKYRRNRKKAVLIEGFLTLIFLVLFVVLVQFCLNQFKFPSVPVV